MTANAKQPIMPPESILYVEDVIERLGNFGPWQIIVFSQCFLMELFYGAITMIFVFMEYIPDHVCEKPAGVLIGATNWTFQQIISVSTPKDDTGNYDYCKYYSNLNYTQMAECSYADAYQFVNASEGNLTSGKCYHWLFRNDTMKNTMVSQWDLVCGRAVNVANAQVLYQAGMILSAIVAGVLADRFGRLKICIIFNVIAAGLGIAEALCPNFIGFLFIRILMATVSHIANNCTSILCLEYCSNKMRQVIGAFLFIPWVIATDVWAGFAYALKDWRYIHILATAPMVLSILFIWTLPESPRWLVAKNKQREAANVLRFAVKINKTDIPELFRLQDVELRLRKSNSSKHSISINQSSAAIKMMHLLRVPKLCMRMIILSYIGFANSLIYFGVGYSISSFSGNFFVNNAIGSSIQVPGYVLALPLLNWGRKKGQILTLLATGVALILFLPIPEHLGWLRQTFAMIGYFSVAASVAINLVYTMELFPTAIRGKSINICSTFSKIGGTVAPYFTLIAQKNKKLLPIPMVIFGTFGFTAGLATLLLPETLNNPLPETLEDCINYPQRRDQKD